MGWLGFLTFCVLGCLCFMLRDIDTITQESSLMLRLMNGDVVEGTVCYKFSDLSKFVIQLHDGTTWEVFDSNAQHEVGDKVVIKRIYDKQYFI